MNALQERPPTGLTIPEFLTWAETADGRWQLRDGEPEMMAPPSSGHGTIQSRLDTLINVHLERIDSRCFGVVSPGVIPELRSALNMLVPDIGITCAPPSAGAAMPEPVVLIEILSPSNEAQTRANVWAYTTIQSVVEIVLVNRASIGAEILRRRSDGTWPTNPEIIDPDGRLVIEALGFDIALRSAYRNTVLVG